MILIFTFVSVVFLSYPPLLQCGKYVGTSKPVCPKSFSCLDYVPFEFPFYNTTDTRCGLIKINCSLGNGTIQIGGESYEIIGRYFPLHGPSLIIRNSTFQKLVEEKSCKALMNNFTSPTPKLFSILIRPSITFFRCPKHASFNLYFNQFNNNYNSYNICKHQYFYYKHPISPTLHLPNSCEVIKLPKREEGLDGQVSNNTDIFNLLSSEYIIHFRSPSCGDQCHKEGYCHHKHENFYCSAAKKEAKLILILVLTGFAFILILSTAIFKISPRYKNNLFLYFLSKDKSPKLEDGSIFFGVSVFSYTELEDATKNFNPSHELGDGGFGTVYYGILQDGREVAVKRLYENNYKRVQHFINEVEILTKLRHPHLVLLYGCTSRQSRELLLVYEYVPNGTVADHLHREEANPGVLTWPIRIKIAIETAKALVYLHASEIIHRDVKTNNILLDHNFSVKVADFGLSRLLPNSVTHVSTAPQGTPGYLDPQYNQRYQLTDKSDVYSFGVVLIELISSMAPVDLNRSQDEISLANLALNRIQRCAIDQLIDPVLGSDSNPEIKNMITSVAELAFRCLQFDSDMRPTMNEVLDVLMEIQAERRIDNVILNPSETNNNSMVLLKDYPPSPISVASLWQSENSASTTQISNEDNILMKIIPVVKPFDQTYQLNLNSV